LKKLARNLIAICKLVIQGYYDWIK